MKRNQKGSIIFAFLLLFLMRISDVNAATATFSRGGSTTVRDTFVNKTIGGKTAYCATHYWSAPATGAVYEKVTSTNNYSKDSYVAGQIIKIAKQKYSGVDQYVYIQEALTCYFRGKASVNHYKDSRDTSFCNDSVVKSLISTAKKYVGEYQFNEGSKTSKLKSDSKNLSINPSSRVISSSTYNSANKKYRYESEVISIGGIIKSNFGGNRKNYYSSTVPKYTLNITSSVGTAKLCLKSNMNSCLSNGATNLSDGNYVLVIEIDGSNDGSNGGSNGGKASISITGQNKSSYPSVNIWKCKSNCGVVAQVMETYVSSVDVNRNISVTQNFTYSAIGKYSAMIEKVDETGKPLENATLRLYIADANGTKISDLCSTNTSKDKTTCSAEGLTEQNGYKNGNQLCYAEDVSPSGYKNIGSKCVPITLNGSAANTTKYYEFHKTDNGWDNGTEIKENGAKILQNYTTFAKSKDVNLKTVFSVANGKKVYGSETSSNVYEYKYVVGDKEKVFYRLSDIPKDSSGKYNDQDVYLVEIPNDMNDTTDKSGIESNTSVSAVHAYKQGDKYIILNTKDENGGVTYTEKSPQETLTRINVYSSSGKVCYNDVTGVAADSFKYCSDDYYMTQYDTSGGNFHITVYNNLNSVKVSKKAITGDDELSGAKLALYTADAKGNCTDTLVSSKNSSALGFSYRAYSPVSYADDDSSSDSSSDNTTDGTTTGGTTSSNDTSSDDTAIDDAYNYLDGLQWTSSDEPVTISGLAAGTYCLVEKVPAPGYKKSTTTTKFTIDSNGAIKDTIKEEHTGDKGKDGTISNVTLIVRNELNKLTISKTDIVSTKELPGAKLRICNAIKKEDGSYSAVVSSGETGDVVSDLSSCDTPNLVDGSPASWESTDKPHEISGLPSGTYALVEITAPNGYATAETIFFKMTDEGVLTDVNGKSLAGNKIVMHDKPINNVKTGDKYLIVIVVIAISCAAIGMGTYCYSNRSGNPNSSNSKIRKRKVYYKK